MLSQMLQRMFMANPLTLFPSIGLCLFMGVFLAVSFRMLKSRASTFDDVARLPLQADEEVRHER